jgi:replicative DNA helicase
MRILTDLQDYLDTAKDTEESIIDRIFDKGRLQGYKVGIQPLNDLIGGIRLGTLTILAGSTGMGKSIVSLNIANDLVNAGVPVFYADLENGAEETIERIIRIKHGITEEYFRDEANKGDNLSKIKELDCFDYMTHSFLEVIQYERLGIKAFLSLLQIQVDSGVKVIFIDPLQALERENNKDNAYNEQGQLVKELKEFAQRNNVAVIVNHHIRKSISSNGQFVMDLDDEIVVKYRIPNIDDLRGSGKITDYATDVWAVVRKAGATDKVEKGKMLFRVLKSRRKSVGDCKLWLNVDTLQLFDDSKAYDDPAYIRGDKQND